jgi:hypothetical protein
MAIATPSAVILKHRLGEVGKTAVGLAEALGVPKSRVYEILAGRRRLQPEEIEPAAAFLEWKADELRSAIARYLELMGNEPPRVHSQDSLPPPTLSRVPIYRAIATNDGLLTVAASPVRFLPSLEGLGYSPASFALELPDDQFDPTFRARDAIVIDPDAPVRSGDDCVFVSGEGATERRGTLARLVERRPTEWRVMRYGDRSTVSLPTKKFTSAQIVRARLIGV